MKLSIATIALSLVSSVQGTCLESLKASLDADSELLLNDGTACSFGQFKRLIKNRMQILDGCSETDNINTIVNGLFGVNKTRQAAAIISEACDNASEPDQTPGTTFKDIFNFNEEPFARMLDSALGGDEDELKNRFLKEFYDGNTFINQHVGGGTYNIPNAAIQSFYRDSAKRDVVAWPSNDDNDVINFDSCQLNTVMCCWVTDRKINDDDNNGNCKGPYPNRQGPEGSNCVDADPADNTDICYSDHGRSPDANHVQAGSYSIYPGDEEGDTHCHGFIYADDDSDDSAVHAANNLFYVSMYDHLRNRGYVRSVPGAPMCGCLEQMPTVSRSDCTQTDIQYLYKFDVVGGEVTASVSGRKVNFNACDAGENRNANDLEAKYEQMVEDDFITDQTGEFSQHIVGEDGCADAISGFMATKR